VDVDGDDVVAVAAVGVLGMDFAAGNGEEALAAVR